MDQILNIVEPASHVNRIACQTGTAMTEKKRVTPTAKGNTKGTT